MIFQSTLPRRERQLHTIGCAQGTAISIHAPAEGATAILAKNPFKFLAKIDKFYYYPLTFLFYNILLVLSRILFVHFFWCESPGDFMCASDSHQRFLLCSTVLQDQGIVCCETSVHSHMLYLCLIFISQIVKSQAVNTFVYKIG